MFPVGKHEHRALYAAEEFFNHHARRGVAEHSVEHVAEFLFCLFKVGYDKYAFSSGQPVGFEHVRRLQRFEECNAFVHACAVECLVCGCGYVVPAHETLGEVLASFQLCACL